MSPITAASAVCFVNSQPTAVRISARRGLPNNKTTVDALPVLERTPEVDGLVVAAGFSGHGFKFASLVGRILSELSIDGRSPRDLAPFRIDRPILQMKDPPRNYMV